MLREALKTFFKWISVPFAVSIFLSTELSILGGRGWILLFFPLVLVVLIWMINVFAFSLIAAFRRQWVRSVALGASLIFALPLMLLGMSSGNYVHLALMYPYYSVEIYRTPDWRSKPFRFQWADQAIWAPDGYQGRVLIYDRSGKTSVGEQYNASGMCSNSYIQPFFSNFYLEQCDP